MTINLKKQSIEKLTLHNVKRAFLMLNSVADQHGMRRVWLDELARLKLTVSFKKQASSVIGLGGYNYQKDCSVLQFNMEYLLNESDFSDLKFSEYKFIASRKDIGSCRGDLGVVIAALVAHECAHVFQFWIVKMREVAKLGEEDLLFGFNLKDARDPHGALWQKLYSNLRVNWVNKMQNYRVSTS